MAPSTTTSRPGWSLAALAVVILLMLGGVLRGNIIHPARWHDSFKVQLGLDLSSGTTVTLKAVPPKGQLKPTQGEMTEAKNIMEDRVSGAGLSGASVQQQGSQLLVVSVPGPNAQRVASLVGQTALLRFRQVLLCSGYQTQCLPAADFKPSSSTSPSTSPSASPSSSGSSSSSASSSPSGSSQASPSSSASTKSSAKPSSSASGSGGTGQAVRATRLTSAAGAAQPGSSSSPKASGSASSKASGSASPAASSSGSPAPTSTASPAPSSSAVTGVTGDASMVNKATMAKFNKLDCSDKNWQQKIYGGNTNAYDDPSQQIVACDSSGVKYALAAAPVTGTQLTSAGAQLNSSNQWIVNFNMNGDGAKALATLTSHLYDTYSNSGTPTSVLDNFAIVLDGNVVSAAYVQSPITGGQGQITGGGSSGFSQTTATNLANVLKYGHLPLSFEKQSVNSVSPEIGSAQLGAGLTAAAIGLLLVVIYSFLYYRGLGVVSVSSLAIAALLSYLSVVLLSRYEHFTLSLAGVAGLIVAIGITADSFVVYFERLRDEVREGRSLRAAVERGWGRARRTILVSDTVSFLAAALLYIFAIGDVKGFAYTLGLTTLIDIVVVFLFTKPMVTLLARTKFYGQGHKLSGLDPGRLGARSPWRGSRRVPVRPRPAGAGPAGAAQAPTQAATPKEA